MARKVTVYQYPTCDTCRKAVSYLKKLGNEPELRNIKSDPPGESELAAMIAASGQKALGFVFSGEAATGQPTTSKSASRAVSFSRNFS